MLRLIPGGPCRPCITQGAHDHAAKESTKSGLAARMQEVKAELLRLQLTSSTKRMVVDSLTEVNMETELPPSPPAWDPPSDPNSLPPSPPSIIQDEDYVMAVPVLTVSGNYQLQEQSVHQLSAVPLVQCKRRRQSQVALTDQGPLTTAPVVGAGGNGGMGTQQHDLLFSSPHPHVPAGLVASNASIGDSPQLVEGSASSDAMPGPSDSSPLSKQQCRLTSTPSSQ